MDYQFDIEEYISLHAEEQPNRKQSRGLIKSKKVLQTNFGDHSVLSLNWAYHQNFVRTRAGRAPIELLDNETRKLDFNRRVAAVNAKFQEITMENAPAPKEDIPAPTLSDEDVNDTAISETNVEDMLSCESTLQYPEELAHALENMPAGTLDNSTQIPDRTNATTEPKEVQTINIIEEFQHRVNKMTNGHEEKEDEELENNIELFSSSGDESSTSYAPIKKKVIRGANGPQVTTSDIAQEVLHLMADSPVFGKIKLYTESVSALVADLMTKVLELTLEVKEMRKFMMKMEEDLVADRLKTTNGIIKLQNEFMRMSSEITAQRNAAMAGVTSMPQASIKIDTPSTAPQPQTKEFDQGTMEAFCYTRFGCQSVSISLLKSVFRFKESFDKTLGHLFRSGESDKHNAWIILIAYLLFTKEGQKDELYQSFKKHYDYIGQQFLTMGKDLPSWIEWLWSHVKGSDQPKTIRGKTTQSVAFKLPTSSSRRNVRSLLGDE